MYCGMLPSLQRHLENIECCRHAQGAPPGRRTAGGGKFQRETVGAGGLPEEIRYHAGTGDGGTQGYFSTLPPVPALMMPVR